MHTPKVKQAQQTTISKPTMYIFERMKMNLKCAAVPRITPSIRSSWFYTKPQRRNCYYPNSQHPTTYITPPYSPPVHSPLPPLSSTDTVTFRIHSLFSTTPAPSIPNPAPPPARQAQNSRIQQAFFPRYSPQARQFRFVL
jgi:hypothetical protein